MGGGEVIVEFGLRKIELDLVEGFERVAEVNQNQITFVAELGEEGRLNGGAGFGALEILESIGGVGGDFLAFAVRAGPPGFPVEAEKLMEEAGTFKGERDWGKFRQRRHLGHWFDSSSC